MKIFLYDRSAAGQTIGFDECRAMVIVAEDFAESQIYLHNNVRDEGHHPWIDLPYTVLGEAAEGVDAGVICSDIWEA